MHWKGGALVGARLRGRVGGSGASRKEGRRCGSSTTALVSPGKTTLFLSSSYDAICFLEKGVQALGTLGAGLDWVGRMRLDED